jgi:hypothetical protein
MKKKQMAIVAVALTAAAAAAVAITMKNLGGTLAEDSFEFSEDFDSEE